MAVLYPVAVFSPYEHCLWDFPGHFIDNDVEYNRVSFSSYIGPTGNLKVSILVTQLPTPVPIADGLPEFQHRM